MLLISLGTLLGVLREDSGPTDSVVISGAAPGTHVPQCLGPSEPSDTSLSVSRIFNSIWDTVSASWTGRSTGTSPQPCGGC